MSVKTKLVTFEEFAQWKPEGGRYELHDGVIVEMSQPTGDLEDVVSFLALEISVDIKRLNPTFRTLNCHRSKKPAK